MNATTMIRADLSSLASIASITPETYSDVRALHRLAVVTGRWRYYAQREIEAKLRQIDNPDYTIGLMQRSGLSASVCSALVATVFWSKDIDRPEDAALSELYVHPGFERCGIGTRLVEMCERLAGKAGFSRLRVRVDLNEREFFIKRGYERERFERNEIEPETCYPLVVMSRQLEQS